MVPHLRESACSLHSLRIVILRGAFKVKKRRNMGKVPKWRWPLQKNANKFQKKKISNSSKLDNIWITHLRAKKSYTKISKHYFFLKFYQKWQNVKFLSQPPQKMSPLQKNQKLHFSLMLSKREKLQICQPRKKNLIQNIQNNIFWDEHLSKAYLVSTSYWIKPPPGKTIVTLRYFLKIVTLTMR